MCRSRSPRVALLTILSAILLGGCATDTSQPSAAQRTVTGESPFALNSADPSLPTSNKSALEATTEAQEMSGAATPQAYNDAQAQAQSSTGATGGTETRTAPTTKEAKVAKAAPKETNKVKLYSGTAFHCVGWVCGFNRVPVGETVPKTLWLQNSSDRNVTLGSVVLVNDDGVAFSLTEAACAGATLPVTEATLPVPETDRCSISVRFSPTSAREYKGRVLVQLPENEVKTLELIGSGAVPEVPEIKEEQKVSPDPAAQPSTGAATSAPSQSHAGTDSATQSLPAESGG